MEHSDLLKEIDRFQSLDESSIRLATAGIKTVPTLDTPTSRVLSRALRAVVELHKSTNGYDRNICIFCSPEILVPYPCPTIQAIEKELK
jgi:hypothetical protein